MEEDNEYLKLPVEEQCVHKLWKARMKGYESAAKLFVQWDEKAPEFSRYAPLMKKFVADSNAVAQERGLETALAFVENAHLANRVCGDVVAGIVQKAIAAPKTSTREKARQVVLMFVEIEKYDVVQEELVKGFAHKNPKVVAGCINTLTCALSEFGHTILNLKSLVKLIPDLMEHKDKNVREETKALVVELQKWIGAAIKPQLSNMKPVLVSELETEFEKNAGERPRQSRFLRSQQQQQQTMDAAGEGEGGAQGGSDAEGDGGVDAPAIDPLDLLEPFNVLAALPKNYHSQLESKKWQERKESLSSLLDLLVKNPRVEPADYSEVVRGLKRIIGKDSNVLVIALAGQSMAALARGLRKHYGPYAVSSLSSVLEKFKEKKQNVVAALREAADAVFQSTTLEAIQEEVCTSLGNKNPSVKVETASFLARSFCYCTPAIFTKKLLKLYLPELCKLLVDSDPGVRDAASMALATVWRVVGEKLITAFMADVERAKLDKVKELVDKVELKVTVPVAKPSKPPPSAASSSTSSAKSQAVVKKPVVGGKKPTKRAVSASGRKTGPLKSDSSASGASSSVPAVERELSDEEAVQLVTELVADGIVKQLADSNWKTRLAAVENVISVVGDRSDVPSQALLIVLTKKPGLRDNNFQVLRLKIQLVQKLATNCPFSSRCLELCVAELVERLPDSKTGSCSAECLLCVAESVSLETTGTHMLIAAFALKSPKVHEHTLLWLVRAIGEFGLRIKPKSMMGQVKKALSHTAVAVRTAAVQLLGVVQLYTGPAILRQLLSDEKPAVLELIDAEIQKLEGTRPPVPTRGVKAVVGTTSTVSATSSAAPSEPSGGCSLEDLVPRVDISDRLTPTLMAELNDKNWKVRSEALNSISEIVRQSQLIEPNLSDLPQLLASRCSDSNKNLAVDALKLVASLASAVGSRHASHQLRYLMSGAAAALADAKPAVRLAAVSALSAWSQHIPLAQLLGTEELQRVARTGTPTARSELFSWLASQLRQEGVCPGSKTDLQLYISSVLAAVEDRSPDVRRAASDAVAPLMSHTGYEVMTRAVSAAKLKPGSQSAVMALLEREKISMPSSSTPNSQSVENLAEGEQASKSVRGRGTVVRGKAKPRASMLPRAKTDSDLDAPLPLQQNGLKQQRTQDELRLRTLKWNFSSPRVEFVDQLKEQMTTAGVADSLMAQLFHADFKQHLKAIESLTLCADASMAAVVANLDLLMKWLTLRLFDTNPAVVIRGLDLFHLIFQRLPEHGYHLSEHEATSFVPYLLVKLGDAKETVRASTRNILRAMYPIYPTSKMFVFVMDGLKSKNGRQRAECLEELGYLIESYALGVCQPSPGAALKEVARQIGDRDNNVRKAALNTLVQAFYLCGDKLFKLIGNLSDKDRSLLEERIKRAPPKPVTPPVSARSDPVIQQPAVTTDRLHSDSYSYRGQCDTQSADEPVDDCEQQPECDVQRADNDISRYADQLAEQIPQLEVPDVGQLVARHAQRDEEIRQLLSEPPMRLPTASRDWSGEQKRVSMFDPSDLQHYVSQLTSTDRSTVHTAVDRLNLVLKSEEPEALVDLVSQVLDAVCSQFSSLLPLSSANSNISDTKLPTLKELTQLVILMLHYPTLCTPCSQSSLREVFSALLHVIAASVTPALAEVSSVANKLIIRLADKANHTNALCVLISLLHQCVKDGSGASSIDSEYCSLLMKCIWKMVRSMDMWVAHDLLDATAVLDGIHSFLTEFPSSWWHSAASDTPLRTVKTLLHRLTTIYGYIILTKIGKLPELQHSETMEFIFKVLSTTAGKPSAALTGETANSDAAQTNDGEDGGATQRQGQQTDTGSQHERVELIFKKIASKESTKEGIYELYDFKQSHPNVSLNPYLDKCSTFFRNYVERGLKLTEQDRHRLRSSDQRIHKKQPDIPVGQAKFKEIQKRMAEINSTLPPQPSRDQPDYEAVMACRQLAIIDLMVKTAPQLEDSFRQQRSQLQQLSGRLSQQPVISENIPRPPVVDSPKRSEPHPINSNTIVRVPRAASMIPQPQSQSKPAVAASEIEEYKRRLARLRRNEN